MTKRVANGYGELAEDIGERLHLMPKAVWDGKEGRMVPVRYNVEVVPLVSMDEHKERDHVAYAALRARDDRDARQAVAASSALVRYTNAQQSDDGIGTSFMTRSERALASYEWGTRLRKLLDAGKRRDREKERNQVLCDPQWED